MWLFGLAAGCVVAAGTEEAASWVDKLDHGSYGGFPTLEEAGALLDGWLAEYPDLMRRTEIGQSYEKRPIHAYVLAAPPPKNSAAGDRGNSQSTKVQVLITSLTHSREPATLTVVLYAVGHLLELYRRGDPEAIYVLEGRELWAVPFVNPDGYVANKRLGLRGMIRKNRRPTCANAARGGVDINRNFGVAWKKDAFPKCDEEYGGTAPFSEPETQAIKRVCDENNFKAAMNFHSFGSMLTHPWNYAKTKAAAKLPNPDDDVIFQELQEAFKFELFGAAINTVGYYAIGESDDWLYGEKGIIAMSPEVGPESGGFYPSKSLIKGIDSLNFGRTMHLMVKSGLELKVDWRTSAGSLRLQLTNSGLSESMGAVLRVVVTGLARIAPSAMATLGATVDVQQQQGGAGLEALVVGEPSSPALGFEVPPLARRSSVVYTLALGVGAPEQSLLSELQLCAVEVGASRACHCHSLASAGKGPKAATHRVLPGADDFSVLCGVAMRSLAVPAPASVAGGDVTPQASSQQASSAAGATRSRAVPTPTQERGPAPAPAPLPTADRAPDSSPADADPALPQPPSDANPVQPAYATSVDVAPTPSPTGVKAASPSPSGAHPTQSPSPEDADPTPSPSPSGADDSPSPSPSGAHSPSPSGAHSPSPSGAHSPSPSGADPASSPSPSSGDPALPASLAGADLSPSPSPEGAPDGDTPTPSPSARARGIGTGSKLWDTVVGAMAVCLVLTVYATVGSSGRMARADVEDEERVPAMSPTGSTRYAKGRSEVDEVSATSVRPTAVGREASM